MRRVVAAPRTLASLLLSIVVIGLSAIDLAALQAGPVEGANRRRLAAEDYYRLKSVGSPELSPDGRWVAFTVSTRIEETNGDSSEVWLAPADGSAAPRRVSRAGENAAGTAWLDDGRLRYSVGRSGFAIDPALPATDPRPAPAQPEGRVSPDGRWIAHVRPVPAIRADRLYTSDFERRHAERFKGARFDWLNFQRDGAPFPAPDPFDPITNPPSEIVLQPADGGEERRLLRGNWHPGNVVWSPDGRSLIFTADSTRDERRYTQNDIWMVAVSDGRITRLTPDDGLTTSNPRWSPDGRFIAFTRSVSTNTIIARKMNHGGPTDLYVLAASDGSLRNLTAEWDLQAGTPIWHPDSRWIFFSAQTGGATHLFRVSPAGGPVEQVTTGERRIQGISFDRAFSRMAYTVGLLDAPPEVHVARIDGSEERRITNVHAPFLKDVALSPGETVRFRSGDGTPIEGFLLYPADYRPGGGPWPLIVNSHGGPHAASGYDFDFKLQYFAANGYFVLETNFRSSTGYGHDFLWATWGAWGTKDGQDVIAGVDYVIANFPVDRNRVGHMGHSYGGFMTNWLITQYPDRLAAAISGAGISNWVSDYGTADIARTKETEFFGYPWEQHARDIMIRQSPLTWAGRVRTPTLFVHGEVDQRVPWEEAEQMYTALKKLGIPASVIQYEGMAHGIRGHWNNVHRMLNELEWWERWLKPRA